MDINVEALVPFIEALVEMSGMEVTTDTVDMFSGMMMAEFEAETTDISDEDHAGARRDDALARLQRAGCADDIRR